MLAAILRRCVCVRQRLLLTTKMNISEVAALCGFSGSNYFGDAFARAYGISPGEYRRHMLAENNAKKAKST
ncbi:MAG: helix-turn-helix domain-containing protein [Ruminococcaceae bacterium]|nr:helix-turn-helix domain-containing protein [Oscillospiraceae bacterium]